jgi:hypothetical protein
MRFVFIDEYHTPPNTPKPKKYTSAIASVWEASCLARFRTEFIQVIAQAINKEPSHINRFPTIHANNMAPEYDYAIRLLCFKTIASLCRKFSVDFYHLGYFHHTPLVTSPLDHLELAVTQLCKLVTDTISSEELVFVYELNPSKHRVISRSYNDWETHYLHETLGNQNLSVTNSANVIGRFYCDKKNYHMAATDTVLWLRNAKADDGKGIGNFKSDILSETAYITDLFKFDEIIQLNAFPYKRSGEGPIRYAHNVTPSDAMDLSEQFVEFLERLKIYWGPDPR